MLNNLNTLYQYLDGGRYLVMYSHDQNKLSYIHNEKSRVLWELKLQKSSTGNEDELLFHLNVLELSEKMLIQLISIVHEEVLTYDKEGRPIFFYGDDVADGLIIIHTAYPTYTEKPAIIKKYIFKDKKIVIVE